MTIHFKFNKILKIKDNEKEQMVIEYHHATHHFEKMAEKLYGYLKQKEDLEEKQKVMLNNGVSIQHIRQQQQWVKNLEKSILHYQSQVIYARKNMQTKQLLLQEKSVEVKKYEKLKENHRQTLLQEMNLEERKVMDEISIQQFVNRGN